MSSGKVRPQTPVGSRDRSPKQLPPRTGKGFGRPFFVSLSVRDPPYTKREQNQFFKQLEAAFLSNDRDGDGFISFSELQRAVTRLKPGRGVKFFAGADLNRDGVLGFGEYLELEFG